MTILKKQTVLVREPTREDEKNFLAAMQSSQTLHYPWVISPQSPKEFDNYIKRSQQENQKSFLVCDQLGNIVGVFNFSEIVRGFFQNAYLGFYAVAQYADQGYMSAGLQLVLQKGFEEIQLHRIEANIQPGNTRSINFVKNNGFRKEGYSKGYLKINGIWCDHERWAIIYEDFKQMMKENSLSKMQ